MTTYTVSSNNYNQNAAEIVDGSMANSSNEEQFELLGSWQAVADDIARFYEEENVKWLDDDGDEINVASYVLSYLED